MELNLTPDLEAALQAAARRSGIAPEQLAMNTLRKHFLGTAAVLPPQDDWERTLRGLARKCSVSLSNTAVSSEGLYE